MHSEIIPLFSTPLYKSKVIIDTSILNYIKQLEFIPCNNSGDSTKDFYILDHPFLSGLKKEIEYKIEDYLRNILQITKDIDFKFLNSWATRHAPGDYAPKHIHTNCLFSGIVYLYVEEKSGDIIFTNGKRSPLYPEELQLTSYSYNIHNARSWSIRPEIGDILIFPSTLHHEVVVNNSKNDRFVLAFNIFPTGILGKNSIAELRIL